MASIESIKRVLAASNLFEGLSSSELDQVAALGREEVYEAGDTVLTEGAEANALYVIEDGKVALEMAIRLGTGTARRGSIDVVTTGQAFGWSAVAASRSFTMTAKCIERTTVIALDGPRLQRLMEENPHMGYLVLRRLVDLVSSRLSRTRHTLAHILSIASHDLKAPLAAVESYNQVMLGGYAGEVSEKQRTMLARSSERIKGLLDLIDNILDISRIETATLKTVPISLVEVVESVLHTIQPLASQKGLQLRVDMPATLPLIAGAPARLQQVFTNLLGNAVKFTPRGGEVTLKICEAGDCLLATVTDNGIGITAEDKDKIFTGFYRGSNVNSAGAGLGLSIARKIVEAHGGKIWVESPCPDTGVGSRFSLTLPRNVAAPESEKEKALKL